MTKRLESKIPFVGLHAHSVAGSLFDALGYPDEHMEYSYYNGMDALALSDHGNANGLSHQVLHAKKMKEEGKDFKPIFGVEAYFIPSLEEWREEYKLAMEDKKRARSAKQGAASGASVEDEGGTKKSQDVLRRRRHLVLLAQNQKGLQNIFKLISESYRDENFYRYPRMDYEMLSQYSEGVIAASACMGGIYAGNYWENRDNSEEAVLDAMRKTTRRMMDIFGDRWFGELQWNNIPEQHVINKYVIQMHREFGIKLISTADSHYPSPDAWKDRELYKRLGWLGKSSPEYMSTELPANVEEIGYELYPKNGDQMWASYKKYSEQCGVEYDDDLVLESITRTYDIAHNLVESFLPDNTVKLPSFVVPEGKTASQALVAMSLEGLQHKKLDQNGEYVERLQHELRVINDRGFSKYFLTMKAISDKAGQCMLAGPGRGSAAGSLVAYVLGITQIDPIKYGLLFSRFLSAEEHRAGIIIETGGKVVKTSAIQIQTDAGRTFALTPEMELVIVRGHRRMTVAAISLQEGDELVCEQMKITKVKILPTTERNIKVVPAGNAAYVDNIRVKNSLPTSMPDIDFDVAFASEFKEQLIEDWGDTNVVPISNWNTLQLRSLIKDISKFYGLPFQEVNEVTGRMLVEATPTAKKAHGIKAGVYVPTFEEVKEYSPTLGEFLKKYPHIASHIDALYGQVRSCSRHAGGLVCGENLDERMPLINSKGVRQTPWAEGQNVRHLEPMGFIKFDILGLSTLAMIDGAIRHILKRHKGIEDPTFDEVKNYYVNHLNPDTMDLSNQEVYEKIFRNGKWAGIFQFTEKGAQAFCQRAKPTSIVDIAAITSIFRPGPLASAVDDEYVEAKENPQYIKYIHPLIEETTEETYGFLIFQEQIAILAHKLGKDLSLDEGNKLRKLLTKKGTGKGHEAKMKLHKKFIEGCVEKGIRKDIAQTIWDKFEYFSGYGFNKSHAISYSMLSYQCAWLAHHYPAEWTAAFLDKEPEKRKEKAINIAKGFGFNIKKLDINTSGKVWEISDDGKTLIQPLTSIKGLGDSAMEQILANRPFNNIEEFLFNENITYSKLNKKALDVLVRSGAMNCLADKRFSGLKHFWSAVAVDRPRKLKNLEENIELYRPEGDFEEEDLIQYTVDLTGVFPMSEVLSQDIRNQLDERYIPPIGDYDTELQLAWFIPRKIVPRKTKNNKDYWVVEVIDDTGTTANIKCWGVKPHLDILHLNKPYMARLDHHPTWGFSTRSIRHNFRLLG